MLTGNGTLFSWGGRKSGCDWFLNAFIFTAYFSDCCNVSDFFYCRVTNIRYSRFLWRCSFSIFRKVCDRRRRNEASRLLANGFRRSMFSWRCRRMFTQVGHAPKRIRFRDHFLRGDCFPLVPIIILGYFQTKVKTPSLGIKNRLRSKLLLSKCSGCCMVNWTKQVSPNTGQCCSTWCCTCTTKTTTHFRHHRWV